MIPPPPPIDIVMSCIYIYYVLPGLLNSKTQSLACSTMTKTKQDCPRKEIFVTYTKIITLFSLHFAPFPFISCARLCLPSPFPIRRQTPSNGFHISFSTFAPSHAQRHRYNGQYAHRLPQARILGWQPLCYKSAPGEEDSHYVVHGRPRKIEHDAP